jgi:hypothetical protein
VETSYEPKKPPDILVGLLLRSSLPYAESQSAIEKAIQPANFVAKDQVQTEEIDIEMDAFSGPGRNEDM